MNVRLWLLFPLALATVTVSLAQVPDPSATSRSYLEADGSLQPVWFICDAVNAPTVAVVGQPDGARRTRITVYSKSRPGTHGYNTYTVGPADPGAGQVYYSLRLRAEDASSGDYLHAFNPGMFDPPGAALTPTFTSVRLGGDTLACRWVANTRLMGFTTRRSVLVTETAPGVLTYETFDFGDAATAKQLQPDGVQQTSTPSLRIEGGTRRITPALEIFTFSNAGYTYQVQVARQGQPAQASLTVSYGGRALQTERLTGYTYAERP
ncbi:hypothetical protein HNR42_000186 [Deinobacterium chartae]|uniref:Uncharacterized protein n=1 Tax=Deinobacterium chartae TaxID=521158 RepID=A0A841HVT0_9DEIO|nr:hypothetical protein [Deinobacterium chartae]MBB6096774.1 hypothetical protein [Deinobacterium chartae]